MADHTMLDHEAAAAAAWRRLDDERAAAERVHATRLALLRAQYEKPHAAQLGVAGDFDD